LLKWKISFIVPLYPQNFIVRNFTFPVKSLIDIWPEGDYKFYFYFTRRDYQLIFNVTSVLYVKTPLRETFG
jgi:hypothetical protein